MNFIDNLKFKWKLCLHWTVPLWSLYYWYNICTKLLHLEAMWDEIKGKMYFEWISHKCKMLFNIFLFCSLSISLLYFLSYTLLNLFTLTLPLSQHCTYGYVWVEDMKNFSFFSLFLFQYVNIEMYRIICWIRVRIYNLQAYYTFFFSISICILCTLLPCVSIFSAFFMERMEMLCSLFVSWLWSMELKRVKVDGCFGQFNWLYYESIAHKSGLKNTKSSDDKTHPRKAP